MTASRMDLYGAGGVPRPVMHANIMHSSYPMAISLFILLVLNDTEPADLRQRDGFVAMFGLKRRHEIVCR
jgi:hypothetical protein